MRVSAGGFVPRDAAFAFFDALARDRGSGKPAEAIWGYILFAAGAATCADEARVEVRPFVRAMRQLLDEQPSVPDEFSD